MKKRLLQLVCNDDDKLSRTQVTIIVVFIYTIILTTLEIIFKDILTVPVSISLFMLFMFAFIDRIDARHLNLKFTKSGIQLEVHEDEDCSDEKVEKTMTDTKD